jgi:hypothetical protein
MLILSGIMLLPSKCLYNVGRYNFTLNPKMPDQKAEKYCISAIVKGQKKELLSHIQA